MTISGNGISGRSPLGAAPFLAVELVIAAVCAIASVWAYQRGVVWNAVPADPPVPAHLVSRYVGGWIAVSAVLATLALILLLNVLFRLAENRRRR